MSIVTLLCADRPMPLHEARTRRMRTVRSGRYILTVEEDGFSVREHEYYRWAVNELGLAMKPYQYELDLRATEEDAEELRGYLRESCRPGERVELWQVWVGEPPGRVTRFSGPLAEVALDTLQQLEEGDQTCMTIEI